jgi:hypothetical protein
MIQGSPTRIDTQRRKSKNLLASLLNSDRANDESNSVAPHSRAIYVKGIRAAAKVSEPKNTTARSHRPRDEVVLAGRPNSTNLQSRIQRNEAGVLTAESHDPYAVLPVALLLRSIDANLESTEALELLCEKRDECFGRIIEWRVWLA